MKELILTGLMAYNTFNNYKQKQIIDRIDKNVNNIDISNNAHQITSDILRDMCESIDKLRGKEFKIDHLDMMSIIKLAKEQNISIPTIKDIELSDSLEIDEIEVEKLGVEGIVKLLYVEDVNWPRVSDRLKGLREIVLYDENKLPLLKSSIQIRSNYLNIDMPNSYLMINVIDESNYNVSIAISSGTVLELHIDKNRTYNLFDNAIDHFKCIIREQLDYIISYSTKDPSVENLLYFNGTIRAITPNIKRYNTYITVKDLDGKEYNFEIEDNDKLYLIPVNSVGNYVHTRRVFRLEENAYGMEYKGVMTSSNRVEATELLDYRNLALVEIDKKQLINNKKEELSNE